MTLLQILRSDNYAGLTVGSVIVLANGYRALVGKINQEGGVCDCCRVDFIDAEVREIIPPTPELLAMLNVRD